jgi:hypothetical protein
MRNFLLLLMPVLGSGCATMASDVHHFSTRRIGDSLTLLTSSSQIIVTNPDGSVCVGPPPDATADMGMAASVALIGGKGGDGVGSEEEELPLGGRNPNVLVTRDLLFQSCLAESRLALSSDERKAHYQALLDLLAKINSDSLEGKNVENVDESGDQNVALPSDR